MEEESGQRAAGRQPAKVQVKDRRQWKMTVQALCSTRSEED